MKRVSFVVAVVAAAVLAGHLLSAQQPAVRITYLYDNTGAAPGTKSDWGFACLLERGGRTVLFDTGAQASVLRQNMAALKVDAARIQALVLSHDHGDHTMGIGALRAGAGLPVYAGEHFELPPEVVGALKQMGARRIAVAPGKPAQVFPGFTVTGEMGNQGSYEEALVVDTPEGSVVIVGCAHPGIVAMLRQVATMTKRPIYMVIGGFHLLQTPAPDVKRIIADFRKLGVTWVGPAHCTGGEALRLFREAYRDHFIAGGVGTVVNAPMAIRTAR